MAITFRDNVAGIVEDGKGKILICERLNQPEAWQFPQGGVDEGEDRLEAIKRELEEEISLEPSHYEIISQKGIYRYRFPNGRRKMGHDGQQQTYFLCRLKTGREVIDLDTEEPEFSKLQWVAPEEFRIGWVPDFKREVYLQVFQDFFNIDLS